MEQFLLSGLDVEELRELNRKAKEALLVAETKLEEQTCKVIHQNGAVISFTSDGQTTILNSCGAQIEIHGRELTVNGEKAERPVFDHDQIQVLEKAIQLLKHLRMVSGLEIGFVQGDFEPADLGYVLVPARDVEAERTKMKQFIAMCEQLIANG
ncbi:MAG: hypothetical protein WB502_02580 [Thermoactinomyces sp.]